MKIPSFLDRDDYLQNPIMHKFCKKRGLKCIGKRKEYIDAIEKYANTNKECENDVRQWLLKVVKEGSKDFCYKKINRITPDQTDLDMIEAKIKQKYSDCPMTNILDYTNTKERKLIEYNIVKDDFGNVIKLEFTFSKLMLCGEVFQKGVALVFPVFIEVYLDKGLIISRSKAKTTIYRYDENDPTLVVENRINSMDYAVSAMDEIIRLFNYDVEQDGKIVKKQNYELFYNIYTKYSFTPKEITKQVKRMQGYSKNYIDKIFDELKLNIQNKEKALEDMDIIVEKYISINGDNEEIFKKGRDAYIIRVGADNEMELTKIYTLSEKTVPLQSTAAFFDSKNAIHSSRQCTKLDMTYKRTDDTYFKGNPLVVQFGTVKNYGFFKTTQYAEEEDIQHVLQTIYTNY